jgi:diguanylate cyclase (GGDEF)-like protein/PAS domain S-box-containing protein
MSDEGPNQRRLERERRARKEAEALIERKSRELYELNQALRAEIAERVAAERQLRIYAEVIRSTGEAVAVTDADGIIIDVNPAYESAIGLSREELIGTALYNVDLHDTLSESRRELWHALATEGRWSGEIVDRRSNGESFPSLAQVNTIWDENGKRAHFVCVSRDITALKRSEQQLQKLAFYDTLTKLPNRALFSDRLRVALAGAERQDQQLAVLYLDLDRFKEVNDTLGHMAGDQLLIELSGRIARCLRASDTLARMGGDEFNVLLTHVSGEAEVVAVAERILEAVDAPVRLGDQTIQVGVSIGLSIYPRDGEDANSLQKNADLAMYAAKESGRNRFCLFSPDMAERGDERLSLRVQIDAALRNEEFTLLYQPIIAAGTGEVEGVEAFLRWRRSDGELVAPERFMPQAEQTGLIKRIDCWVLERACRAAIGWFRDGGRELRVSVNISAVSVQQPDMARLIADLLERTGFPPRLLSLEVTETAVITNTYGAQRTLADIAALGVGLAIDDFGTGYSSLSYLTRFPIDRVKLDPSFTERIGKDKTTEHVIQSVLDLARKLKLHVVADGVEQQSQKAFLSQIGCELMQGQHFARLLSGDELREWLAARGGRPGPGAREGGPG